MEYYNKKYEYEYRKEWNTHRRARAIHSLIRVEFLFAGDHKRLALALSTRGVIHRQPFCWNVVFNYTYIPFCDISKVNILCIFMYWFLFSSIPFDFHREKCLLYRGRGRWNSSLYPTFLTLKMFIRTCRTFENDRWCVIENGNLRVCLLYTSRCV